MPDASKLVTVPVGKLGIIPLQSCTSLGDKVNQYLVKWRKERNLNENNFVFNGYERDSYIIDSSCPRFASGEAKGTLSESVRGTDLYLLADVTNYSIQYNLGGQMIPMSPDDHFQDLKRVIAACNGKAHRISVIMPFLYEGRQHRRTARESLDCANALKELAKMGVSDFITFDAHDPRVQNATPLYGFDNFSPSYQMTKELLNQVRDLVIDKEHMTVISPDEGAMDRAIYFSTILGADTGMFYKRRDYTKIVNGKNPIIAHEFLGEKIDGKDVVIIDDMIASGESMLDTSRQLKEMNARRVFLCSTFGLFTAGLKSFDEAHEKGYFDYVITTTLTYLPKEVYDKPYILVADMSKFLASIIDFSNHDVSFANVLTPTEKIHKIVEKYNNRLYNEENGDDNA